MLRRMSFLAPALALTIGLGGCMATETLSINPFAKRGIIRDAGAETASLNPVRTPSLSTRAVVRLAPDITVAGMQLSRVHAESLPGWKTERHGDALAAFQESCAVIARREKSAALSTSALGGIVGNWAEVCTVALRLSPDDHPRARQFFLDEFDAYEVRGEGIFTGYYEAALDGARRPGGAYQWPLYARPKDLVNGQAYLTRAEIEGGALRGRGLELFYVTDPVDAFMLQIQGSGVIRLPDGSRTRVGYAGNNGHEFVSLRAALERQGYDKAIYGASIQSYTRWLKERPKVAAAVMNTNPRFIFFTENSQDGAVGAQGIRLTPERSLAVDLDFMPLHAPLWLETSATAPNGSTRTIRRLMVAQDTGSAINGVVRGDFFWGSGAGALAMAGRMKSPGVYTILLPKGLTETLASE
ncbi:MAG: murein transglycosylase [Rhodospirillaceae bacterium]|nr:MAG: murein transglycosylase [Rhodospirillaceae bacterium]